MNSSQPAAVHRRSVRRFRAHRAVALGGRNAAESSRGAFVAGAGRRRNGDDVQTPERLVSLTTEP